MASAFAAAASTSALPHSAHAASFLWDGGGNNDDWSTNNNWSPNGAPSTGTTTDTITFGGTVRLTPNLNANRTIASLTFLSNTAGSAFTLNSSTGSTLTIGSGGITQNDGDTVTINHALALGASQTWNAAAGDISANAALNLGANTLTIAGSGDTTLAGVISGTGNITKGNIGALTIAGAAANTFSGTTTVNAGTLNLNKSIANGAIVGDLTIGDGSGTDIVSLLAANQIGGSGTITINSSGVLQLNSFADTLNNVVMTGGQITTSTAAGTLNLGGTLSTNAAATSASISGPGTLALFTNNKTFAIADGAAAIDLEITTAISQDIAGRGITKSGAGTMRLSGAGSYSGGLTLGSGTLIINNNTAAGTGTLTLSSGTIKSEAGNTLANAVNLSGTALVESDGGAAFLNLSGAVSGSGSLTIDNTASAGAGAVGLVLSGTSANTQTGTINVIDGVLQLGKTAGINAIAGNLIIGDSSSATVLGQVVLLNNDQIANTSAVTVRRSGHLNLANGNRSDTIGALTLEDGLVTTGAGTLTITGALTSTNVTPGAQSTVSGNLDLGGATRSVSSNGAANTLNLDAVISNGGIAYTGAGTLNLTAANTYNNGFNHGGTGTVNIGNDAALGTGATFAAAGATRVFSLTGGAKTLANPFVLDGPAQFTLPASLTINGDISGAGSISKSGVGDLTLGGAGSFYTGATTITSGKLIVTANNALGAVAGNTVINPGTVLELPGVNYSTAEPLTISGAGGSAPSLVGTSGASTWAGPITLAGNSIISAAGGSLAVTGAINAAGFSLTLDGASASSYGGNISGGASALTKLGAGTATISGVNSYGGATAVLVGTLRVAGAGGNAIPDASPLSIEPGATLEFAANEAIGTIQPGTLGTILLNPDVTATVQAGTFGGVVSGTGGTLSKTTASTLSLQGSSANTFAGTTQVLAGTLNLAKGIADAAIAGSLVIGDSSTSTPTAFVTLSTNDQIANNASVTIRRSGRLDLATGNRSETIGALTLEDGTLATGAGTLTITGALTSNNVTPAQVSTITGNLSLGGGVRSVTSGGGNTLNIDAVVSNGGMWVQGNGIVNLNAANTFAGGFEHGSGATITIGSNAALGSGTITTTAGATRVFAVNTSAKTLSNDFVLNGPAHFALAADLTLTGSISGPAAMSKDGTGTLTLNGPGTFSGGLSATAGMLILNSNAAAGSGTLTLGAINFRGDTGASLANAVSLAGGTVFQNVSAAPGGFATFTGVVSGGGDLTIANPDGSSKIALRLAGTSANTYTGTTQVIDGTLQLAKTPGVNAIAGNVIVGDHSTATMTGQLLPLADDQIANSATVTVRRSGLYNLAEGNRSDIIAGLNLEDGTVAGGTGQLHILGPINSSNVTPGAVSSISGIIALGGAVRTVTSGTNNTLNLDAIVSNGGILLQGNGTLNLTNSNTFALGFEHGGGGTVNIGNNAAFGTNFIATSSGATRVFSVINGAKTITNIFSLNGPVHFALPANLTLTGNIAGVGAISKDGVGDLTLGGLGSNYTGATSINEGKLIVTADNALGLPSAGTTLAAGVPMELPGVNYTAPEPLTINGAGGVNPSLVSTSGTSTWAGPITLASPSIISAAGGTLNVTGAINGAGFNMTLDGALSSTYSGNISGGAGTSLLKRGTGSTRLLGVNSYGGGTNVEAGTLVVGSPAGNTIPDPSPVVVSPGAVLTFAFDETIGDLLGGSSAAINLNPSVNASITSGSFGGAITNTNDGTPGTLRKVGSGTLTLSGANTFGSLVINGGTLQVQAGAAIADTAAVSLANVSGAIFDVPTAETIGGLAGGGATGGNVAIGAGAILTVTGGGTFSGLISGAGQLTKGSGADLFLRGTNSFAGRTTINTGVLDILAESNLGAVPPSFVADQISLDNGGTLRLADGTVTIPINRGITIGANGGRFFAGNADTLTIASRLTGAGTATFAAVGTPSTMPVFALNGTNTTFTGKMVINNAIVTIANDANLSAAPVSFVADKLTLLDGGTLRVTTTMSIPVNRGVTLQNGANALGGAFDVNSAQTLTTLSPITGPGALTKRGAGTLTLSTAHTYTGKTVIESGAVIAQQDANFGSPPLALIADQLTLNAATLRWTSNGPGLVANRGVRLAASSSTITVDAGITMAINGPVSGPGGLTKIGPGTLNLLGTNSYTAATSVGAGRMILNRSFSTNTSIAISAGATLELAQAPAVTVKTSAVVATGKFDVKDDKLIITAQPVGTFNGTAYSGVTAMIAGAYAFGAWSGNGLTTTMPDAQAGLTTLALASADQLGIDTFGGMSVAPSNVLVMYTYAGDANLDGTIDGGDYGIIDNFIQVPSASGYANGDFNYDGAIDGGDYGIIDNNIQAQGPPFPPSASFGSSGISGISDVAGTTGITGVAAVPEPSACGLAFLAAATLLGRRRRRRDPRLW